MSINPLRTFQDTVELASTAAVAQADAAFARVRAVLTLMVVAHHAALAYTTFSVFNQAHYAWSSAPIVDASKWPVLDYFVAWNDIYFMSVLFFISGLYAPESLSRKGPARFLLNRVQRLGGPFVLGVLLLMPLAYWPSWRLSAQATNGGFLPGFFLADGWPVGPPWFLWVLLVINAALAVVWRLRRTVRITARFAAPKTAAGIGLGFFAVTVLAVLPLRLVVAPNEWSTLGGPLDFQTSRVLLYPAYFGLGLAFSSVSLRRAVFDTATVWRWWWLCVALGSFAAHWHMSGSARATMQDQMLVAGLFALCCTSSTFAVIGLGSIRVE
jgi:glucans biosynthesis protein C